MTMQCIWGGIAGHGDNASSREYCINMAFDGACCNVFTIGFGWYL